MSCLISKGRASACNEFIGGVKSIYIANYQDIDGITIDTGNTITELPTGLTLYKYDLSVKNVSNIVETMTVDATNGITSVDQVLTMDLNGNDAETHAQILLMGYGRPQIFVLDNFGNTRLLGRVDGCTISTATSQTGENKKAKYGYTIVFNAEERTFAQFVEGSTVLDPWAGMTNKPTVVTA
jgi:hypothetical protein